MKSAKKEQRTANSTYKKLAVQLLHKHLCFVSSSVGADSFRLRKSPTSCSCKTLEKNCSPTSPFLIYSSIMSYDHSRDFWSFLEGVDCAIPRHHTESCRIGIGHYTRTSLDIARDDLTSTLACMGIDEVVMGTPLSPSSGTAGEEVIFEHDRTDHFI